MREIENLEGADPAKEITKSIVKTVKSLINIEVTNQEKDLDTNLEIDRETKNKEDQKKKNKFQEKILSNEVENNL